MAHSIPERWLVYKPIGRRISGTRFIAFKVPLREHIAKAVHRKDSLDISSLLRHIPNLGLIIDLTNTHRFYDPELIRQAGVEYKKIMVPGQKTPSDNLVMQFKLCVMDFLNFNKNNDKLIGVHCTHGVNRTGYLICNYMISELNFSPEEAISKFEKARGHNIERRNYIKTLRELSSNKRKTDNRDSSEIVRTPARNEERRKDLKIPNADNWRCSSNDDKNKKAKCNQMSASSSSQNWRRNPRNEADGSDKRIVNDNCHFSDRNEAGKYNEPPPLPSSSSSLHWSRYYSNNAVNDVNESKERVVDNWRMPDNNHIRDNRNQTQYNWRSSNSIYPGNRRQHYVNSPPPPGSSLRSRYNQNRGGNAARSDFIGKMPSNINRNYDRPMKSTGFGLSTGQHISKDRNQRQ